MGKLLKMDVSSIRSLMTLVVQLHTIIIFAQALSEEGTKSKSKLTAATGGGGKESTSHTPCCFNGGLCVLGSFCHCPKNFYGRYCEYELKNTPCGYISHGSWMKAGCNLCCCYDGHMTCLPRAFDGCDDKPPSDDEVNPWDYKEDMVIFANDDSITTSQHYDTADNYYDYYAGNGGRQPSCVSVFIVIVTAFFSVCWIWGFSRSTRSLES